MISIIAKIVAHLRVHKIKKTYTKSSKIQEDILSRLLKKAMKTKFGKDHGFKKISNYDKFKEKVPMRFNSKINGKPSQTLVGFPLNLPGLSDSGLTVPKSE